MLKSIHLICSVLQNLNIEEKINKAPDKSHEIGVFMGSIIPFIVLVIIAYMIYYHSKKHNKSNTQ